MYPVNASKMVRQRLGGEKNVRGARIVDNPWDMLGVYTCPNGRWRTDKAFDARTKPIFVLNHAQEVARTSKGRIT